MTGSTNHLHITPGISAMLGVQVDKLQGDTKFASKVMGCQVHAIEKAIRPRPGHNYYLTIYVFNFFISSDFWFWKKNL